MKASADTNAQLRTELEQQKAINIQLRVQQEMNAPSIIRVGDRFLEQELADLKATREKEHATAAAATNALHDQNKTLRNTIDKLQHNKENIEQSEATREKEHATAAAVNAQLQAENKELQGNLHRLQELTMEMKQKIQAEEKEFKRAFASVLVEMYNHSVVKDEAYLRGKMFKGKPNSFEQGVTRFAQAHALVELQKRNARLATRFLTADGNAGATLKDNINGDSISGMLAASLGIIRALADYEASWTVSIKW